MSAGNTPQGDTTETIDREAALLEDAIRLVASHRVHAVTVAGLSLALVAMGLATPLADQLGVTLEPLWSVDQHLRDIRVHLP